MTASLRTRPGERKALLETYRTHPDPAVRHRAHILLLLADGYTWEATAAVTYCSTRTIARWKGRFDAERVDGLAGRPAGRRPRFGAGWVAIAVAWVTERSPRDFGFLRSRWCCAVVVILMLELHGVAVGRETVRRWLHRGGLVYRRPRPVVGPTDAEKGAKLAALRRLLAGLPDDETAVWQDEVEIHTNPKIGPMWMFRGQQAEVETPGTDRKRHLSGSIHWRTGAVFVTEAAPKQGRDGALFIKHLDDLRQRLRRYRKIHVICDNASCHTSLEVIEYLWRWEGRIEVHLLPRYAPETNPIERVWWHLHETVTRNHRCRDLEELLDQVFAFLEQGSPFEIEGSVYPRADAA